MSTAPKSAVTEDRPRLHPTAPRNWLSDPNGPVYWNGAYHVFYQHNPQAPEWGLMHWGHLVSRDLLEWTDAGIALAPSPDGPDRDGVWSGSARIIDGRPVFFYTAAAGEGADHAETVCRAFGSADLARLTKEPGNPLIPSVAAGSGLRQYRDPFLVEVDSGWLMLLGTGIDTADEGGAGAVIAFASADLETWTYRGVLFSQPGGTGPIDTGPVWECPQLLRFGEDWVLIVSVQLPGDLLPSCPYAVWFIGSFDGTSFVPRDNGYVDHGDIFYAPAVLEEESGRRLMWGWLQEAPGAGRTAHAGIAGALSLARALDVHDGRLVSAPAVELHGLWHDHRTIADIVLDARTPRANLDEPGAAYRLTCTVETDAIATLRLAVTATAADVIVRVDRRPGRSAVTIDSEDGAGRPIRLTAPLRHSGPVTLDIWVDHSILEVFAEPGVALTTRLPAGRTASPLVFSAVDGVGRFTDIVVARPESDGIV